MGCAHILLKLKLAKRLNKANTYIARLLAPSEGRLRTNRLRARFPA
jgi:hypothetical protein